MMEYHSNKDSAVAIRIFELGFKLFAENVDYVIKYLQFLLSVNDDSSELRSCFLYRMSNRSDNQMLERCSSVPQSKSPLRRRGRCGILGRDTSTCMVI